MNAIVSYKNPEGIVINNPTHRFSLATWRAAHFFAQTKAQEATVTLETEAGSELYATVFRVEGAAKGRVVFEDKWNAKKRKVKANRPAAPAKVKAAKPAQEGPEMLLGMVVGSDFLEPKIQEPTPFEDNTGIPDIDDLMAESARDAAEDLIESSYLATGRAPDLAEIEDVAQAAAEDTLESILYEVKYNKKGNPMIRPVGGGWKFTSKADPKIEGATVITE